MLEQELIEAVESNSLKRVQELLAAGADPDARKGKQRVLDLVHHRRDDIRCALLEAGARAEGVSLVWAAGTGRLATVEALLAQGADLNMVAHSGTPLQVACALGHREVAERLLVLGADPNAGSSISTPLLDALKAGHDGLALALIGAGADPRHTPRFGSTPPLVVAAEGGREAVVEALLQAGADPDAPGPLASDPVTAPPLIAAILGGHAGVARRLLAAGARATLRDDRGRSACALAGPELRAVLAEFGVTGEQSTPAELLLRAARAGDAAEVTRLLAGGAPADARDERRATRGWTPLMLAARAGHLETVRALLAGGADPAQIDGPPDRAAGWIGEEAGEEALAGFCLGRSALTLAALAGQSDIARALLDADAPVEVKDALGWTPFLLACRQGNLELARLLAERGADLKKKGPQGATGLSLATRKGSRELVEYLLHKSPRKGRPAKGALVAACEAGEGALVAQLLAAGADPDETTRSGQTPLAAAVGATRWVPLDPDRPATVGGMRRFSERGAEELVPLEADTVLPMVHALLAAGADPNKPGFMGPPLMEAARYGHLEAARALAAAGADPGQVFGEHTALSTARLYHKEELVRFLESLGGAEAPAPAAPAPSRTPRPAPVPRFKSSKAFQAALAELSERCASKPTTAAPGLSRIHVDTRRRQDLKVEALQQEFLSRGCFVCWDSTGHEALLAAATRDPFRVVAAVQTQAPNCSLGTGDIIDWLRGLHEEQPFVLTMITPDSLAGRFLHPVRDPRGLAARMYEFCPDIVDQGCGSLQELARQLKQEATLFFWWD